MTSFNIVLSNYLPLFNLDKFIKRLFEHEYIIVLKDEKNSRVNGIDINEIEFGFNDASIVKSVRKN